MADAPAGHEDQAALRELRQRMRAMGRDGSITTRSLSQRVTVNASAHDVYQTLTDEKKHAALTGVPVRLQPQVMGEVDIDNGAAEGIVTEMLDDKHFVMAWRMNTEGWPQEHFSTATFMLRPEEGGKTTVVLFQQDVPTAAYDAILKNWQDRYFERLKDVF